MKTKSILLTTVITLLFIVATSHAQNAEFVWAKQVVRINGDSGYNQINEGQTVTTDAKGNVYVIGDFSRTVDFGFGDGSAIFKSAGQADIFILKLDAKGNLLWAKQLGDTEYDTGTSITTDAKGNVYTIGRFTSTVDFNPGAGNAKLTSAGKGDIFILKLDTNGTFLWVKQMGGIKGDEGNAITIDAKGNIYTTGTFEQTADFDPGSEIVNLTSNGKEDIFIQKLDANGDFVWVKQIGGAENDSGNSITTDANGNIYVTGGFKSTVNFDPETETSKLTSAGNRDIFVLKLDSLGNLVWVKQMGGAGNAEGRSITTDANGNVYSTGTFSGTVDFDPAVDITNLTSAGEYDIFIQKLDSNGAFLWVKQMGSLNYDWGLGITTDATGNIYTIGNFSGTVDFDIEAGTVNLTSIGDFDCFILKLDTNGNFVWAKQMGGTGYSSGNSITVDADDNVYTTGRFEGTVDFDPGTGITNLTAGELADIFILKLSQTTVGISENILSDNMLVYPNPASSKIQIRGENAKGEFRIYNILGKIMVAKTLSDLHQTIDVQHLNPGIYIWQMENRKGKLVVQ